jgi:hypothetical protein
MVIQRSIVSNITQKFSTLNLQKLKDILAQLEPTIIPDVLLAEDTKYGIVDQFLFDKSKPDKNGVYSNVRLIQRSFDNLKDVIVEFQSKPHIFNNMSVIIYKPVNDNYHYLFIKKLNLNKNTIEKYLLLI